MNNALKKAFGLFVILLSFTLISCEEEEYVDPGNCTGDFWLIGPPQTPADSLYTTYLNYTSASASLFSPTCSELAPAFSNNYHMVLYSNSFSWGANGAQVGFSNNGFQGIEITSAQPFVAGSSYQLLGDVLGFNSNVQVPGGGFLQLYQLLNTSVSLTEAGDEVGENVSGTVVCTLQATNGSLITVTGTFCVPVVEVCN
jgi:hypothetical protein